MEWKLFYDDGSTYSWRDGDWADAPYRGALVLVSSDPEVGRELDHGARGEFFAWWPEASKPWGFDRVGILDYLTTQGWSETTLLSDLSLADFRDAGVKLGRSVENEVFRETMRAARDDPDFEPKSAKTAREAIE